MPIAHGEARAVLARWQPILRLADWGIDLRLVTGTWRKSGDVKVKPVRRQRGGPAVGVPGGAG